jgi:hypothetical protein
VRAIKAHLDNGGKVGDLDKLRLAALRLGLGLDAVTQGLTALKPFTFPAVKPKPAPSPDTPMRVEVDKPAPPKLSYLCPECASSVSDFYCRPCRTEWEARRPPMSS